MRSAVVSIDPRTGGVKAYYGGSDANGFDFAQAGLPTGSSFKVFALVAALQQGIGLGYQIDSSPVEVNGIKITNVEGEGCGTCTIAEALKRSLNTSYYRLMLKLKNGPQDVADAAHAAGIAESFPGVEHTLSEDGKGGPPNNGIVLGQYQSRVHRHGLGLRHARRRRASTTGRTSCRRSSTPTARCCSTPSQQDNAGEQKIDKAVADNVTAAMQPIAGYSKGHNLAGGRASAAKTGTNQLGDTGANRDAWMVGYTPSLSTAVWVGTTEGTKPLVNSSGGPVYGSGLPSDIWKATMDGALEGHRQRDLPEAHRDRWLRGPAAGPAASAAAAPAAAVGDGDPADAGARARHHDPVRSADDGDRLAPPGPPAPPGDPGDADRCSPRPRQRPLRRRDRRRAESATVSPQPWPRPYRQLRWHDDLRSRDDRDLPSRNDVIGRGAVERGRRSGRQARADRAGAVPDPAAGDAGDRAGVPRVRLHHQGRVPAVHGHRHRRPAGGRVGEPARLLRALLLRHRAAVHRGAAEPGQVSVQVELGREERRGHAPQTQYDGTPGDPVHGVSGADRAVPVRVDGAGQDLHGVDQAGGGADRRRGGDVLQHRRVRAGAGVDGHGVGDRAIGRAAGSGTPPWSRPRRC